MPWKESELPEFNPRIATLQRVMIDNTKIIHFQSGMEQRWSIAPIRFRYILTFRNLTKEETDYIYNFYLDRKGKLYPFKFNDPWEDVMKFVRFDSSCDFTIELLLYSKQGQLELIEVHPSEILIGQ